MKKRAVIISLTVLLLCLFIVPLHAASQEEINAKVTEALDNFYKHSSAAKSLAQKSAGMLVFPEVIKAGFFVGGEYGEGALLIGGKTVDYYNVVSASIGLQFGGQMKSEVILFMTQEVLSSFRNSQGWEAGVDGSVALLDMGVGKEIDTENIKEPIIGFIFSNQGLMANFSLEGSKITKIQR